MNTCQHCGELFEAKRSTAKYCSTVCRVAESRSVAVEPVVEPATREIIPEPITETNPVSDTAPNTNTGDLFGMTYEERLAAFRKKGIESVDWLATKTELDKLTMFPVGRIVEIYGKEGVGKTTLALNLIKNLTDKKILYIDTEGTLDPDRLTALSLNPKNFDLKIAEYSEDIYDTIVNDYEKYDLIVVDSVANASFRSEAQGEAADANIGQKAKIFNKLMRVVTQKLRQSNTTLILINQERESIGGYTTMIYTPGGNGIKYAASLRIRLTTTLGSRFPKTAPFKGQVVTAEIKKSKVNQPFRKGDFKLYYV